MCLEKAAVSLWVVLETPVGAWVGEGQWPIPETADGDNELTTRIQCALISAILKQVKGTERFSMTLFLNNQSARPIDWAFQQDEQLQRGVLDNAEQICWKEWRLEKE